ncbi:Fringe-like protein [Onchocerca flexuosa]|uniref:Fringe-like protein n=1 Tax=Onchocerca flexuosa TaxID=387005 RepID=A0A238BZI9_9BILA|nr:Fringe-like protein [Onchocerca flexuosa]
MRTTRQKTYLTMALLAIILIYSFIDKGFGHYSSHIESVPTTSDLDGLIYFITDTPDAKLNEITGGKLIVSDCSDGHTREGLCCKMNAELELFLSQKTRPSTMGPVGVDSIPEKATFWFATGGAGFCLSKSLLAKMSSYVRNGGFEELGEFLRLPDDVSLGYLIEHLLKVKLTVLDKFHSHLENLDEINKNDIHKQISFSAGGQPKIMKNVVRVPEEYIVEGDPQRFRSLHCFLYRKNCQR